MCFNRSLGNVEILSDFCVVTSLQQQIDDLLFAGPHFIKLLFHKTLHLTDAPWSPQVALEPGSETLSGFGSSNVALRLILHSLGQSGRQLLTKCENVSTPPNTLKKRGYYSDCGIFRLTFVESFAHFVG
jgi:hypothetical protein